MEEYVQAELNRLMAIQTTSECYHSDPLSHCSASHGFCHNTAPDYAFGALEPRHSVTASAAFDQSIDVSLGKIAQLRPDNRFLRELRSLPMAQGGLGIYAYQARTEYAAITARNSHWSMRANTVRA
jgi:hypothetical protein